MDATEGASTSTWFKPHIEDKSRSARRKYRAYPVDADTYQG